MQQGFQILVIDDDVIFNQSIKSFLSSHGVRVELAISLAEAREFLRKSTPNFILLDYLLKGEMGIDLMKDVNQCAPNVPVIMITADDDQETMKQCFQQGVDDYLLKPINFELLWLKIQRLFKAISLQAKVKEQAHALQRLLDEKQVEEVLARHVYEYMANHASKHNKLVNSLMLSSSAFNGDTLIVCKAPNGNTSLILMDATGHGLAAAISVLPLASVFSSMVEKGLELSTILLELNNKLNMTIPDDRFVSAVVIEIEKNNHRLNIWNGGMPDVLMLDNDGKICSYCTSSNMPLGILENNEFDARLQSFDIQKGGHLVICSDGLLEQESANKQVFGMGKLKEILSSSKPQNYISDIEQEFRAFIGNEDQVDDVSVCHIDINQLLEDTESSKVDLNGKVGGVKMNLALNGTQMENFDILHCIDTVMKQANVPLELRQRSFTVCTELVANAIEHGVLALASDIKAEENGFMKFLDLRQQRMKKLTSSDGIKLAISYDSQKPEVGLKVSDSGDGFEPSAIAEQSQFSLSGRGLKLVKSLSTKMQYSRDTNQVNVIIK